MAATLLIAIRIDHRGKVMRSVDSEPTQRRSPKPQRLKAAPSGVPVERELLLLEVACAPEAAGLVRAAVRRIEGLGAMRDDAILVASELVTNAVVHSGGSPADTIRVRATLVGGQVSISVHDPGLSADSPYVRAADISQRSGRGLLIVKRVARRWGFERDYGSRVWAELANGAGS